MTSRTIWRDLDPDASPQLVWIRPVAADTAVFLLGAFDPPTVAHLTVLRAAASHAGITGTFCLTKVLLDRDQPPLLDAVRRLELLEVLGAECDMGLAVCNRGAYVEVAEAARSSGVEPVFVVGSDKLPQLEDPRFYLDGEAGIARTFASARFIVVPRGTPVTRDDVDIVDLEDPHVASISSTRVRERLRRGEPVDRDVPPVVAVALRDYIGSAERSRAQ